MLYAEDDENGETQMNVYLPDKVLCSEIRKRMKIADIIEYILKQK